MFNVATLTPVLHLLFTATADELARLSGFIQRRGQFTGADFLQALVLGHLKQRTAPLEALAQPLGISRQALDQRFNPAAAAFCRLALSKAVEQVIDRRGEVAPLLRRFQGVFVDDCTQAWMPDDARHDFAGCGSGDPRQAQARMKVLARWDIQSGNIHHLGIHAGRTSDHQAQAQAPPLPRGCLHLADLGFADFARLRAEAEGGVFWVSRLPAQTHVDLADGGGRPLAEQLRHWREQGRAEIDTPVRVGNKDAVSGRLVAFACPGDIVARRLAKLEASARRRGRPVSPRQRELCRWTVLFTNVAAEGLSVKQVWMVYRLRGQIELLFKRLKSEGGLDQTRSGKRERVECEWYVKLLGQVVRNWLQLRHGGPLRDVNAAQVGRVISDHLGALAKALRGEQNLDQVLADIDRDLGKLRRRTARRTRPTASQLLAELEPAA